MSQSRLHHVATFILKQAFKTIRRPSRLFFAPLYWFILTLSRFPRIALSITSMLPVAWMEREDSKRIRFAFGNKLFQHGRPAEALRYLDLFLHTSRPSIAEDILRALCMYQGFGRFRDAMSQIKIANDRNLKEADSLGLADSSYRVLDSVWASHIGQIATLDYVIKLGILEGRARNETILYLPPGSSVGNRFLLQEMAEHFQLIEDPANLPFNPSAVQALHFNLLGPRLPDRSTAFYWEVGGKTYERWQREGKGSLLTLPPETEARGWAALHDAGIPDGAWFVALHVREGKWDGRKPGLQGILNADIATYSEAIAEISRRGGWVIRMGDPSMKPLPSLPNVIDYCHSDLRADWMDVFLAAHCRFMIGTSSGPAYIPPLYGVPSVLTNWWPPAQRPWHASDIFIPKMLRRLADGQYLTLGETLSEPFSYCHSLGYLADHEGIRIEDNDPEIIRSAVEEMLARLDGVVSASNEVSELRLRADEVYGSHGAFGMGQLAGEFLRRHGNFIA